MAPWSQSSVTSFRLIPCRALKNNNRLITKHTPIVSIKIEVVRYVNVVFMFFASIFCVECFSQFQCWQRLIERSTKKGTKFTLNLRAWEGCLSIVDCKIVVGFYQNIDVLPLPYERTDDRKCQSIFSFWSQSQYQNATMCGKSNSIKLKVNIGRIKNEHFLTVCVIFQVIQMMVRELECVRFECNMCAQWNDP